MRLSIFFSARKINHDTTGKTELLVRIYISALFYVNILILSPHQLAINTINWIGSIRNAFYLHQIYYVCKINTITTSLYLANAWKRNDYEKQKKTNAICNRFCSNQSWNILIIYKHMHNNFRMKNILTGEMEWIEWQNEFSSLNLN